MRKSYLPVQCNHCWVPWWKLSLFGDNIPKLEELKVAGTGNKISANGFWHIVVKGATVSLPINSWARHPGVSNSEYELHPVSQNPIFLGCCCPIGTLASIDHAIFQLGQLFLGHGKTSGFYKLLTAALPLLWNEFLDLTQCCEMPWWQTEHFVGPLFMKHHGQGRHMSRKCVYCTEDRSLPPSMIEEVQDSQPAARLVPLGCDALSGSQYWSQHSAVVVASFRSSIRMSVLLSPAELPSLPLQPLFMGWLSKPWLRWLGKEADWHSHTLYFCPDSY